MVQIPPVSSPATLDEARRLQADLASRVELTDAPGGLPTVVTGLDVSYRVGSDDVVAAAVVIDIASGEIIEHQVVRGTVTFPYTPGLLAFREIPMLLEALRGLRTDPGLLLCDGQGIAHPRRCGLASHLGVLLDLPAVGCAKRRFIGTHDEPGQRRGDRAALVDGTERIGSVLRTQDGVAPVFVSPGHRIDHEAACELVLAAAPRYRLPDPVRHADRLSRAALVG